MEVHASQAARRVPGLAHFLWAVILLVGLAGFTPAPPGYGSPGPSIDPGFFQVTGVQCRNACRAERDACMAQVGRPGGPRPQECVRAFSACVAACPAPPPPPPPPPPPAPSPSPCNDLKPCYLTRKGLVSQTETTQYYDTVDPGRGKRTLAGWKSANGFGSTGGGGDVRAIYYQAGDLDIGRDMNCRQRISPTAAEHAACLAAAAACNACQQVCRAERDQCMSDVGQPDGPRPAECVSALRVCSRACGTCRTCAPPAVVSAACYVTNYGPEPGKPGHPDQNGALADAVANAQGTPQGIPFATVAMEYTAPGTAPNSVKFYAYGKPPAEGIILEAALDTEGAKSLPTMCMACHGGFYNPQTNSIAGASFLPFDLAAFRFSQTPAFTQASQEEAFRQLNQMVKSMRANPVNSNNPVGQLIDLWYPDGVGNAHSKFRADQVPSTWNNQRAAYLGLVAPYCRGCHIANTSTVLDFHDHDDFLINSVSIARDVCENYSMPHAEVPFKKLWATNAARFLDSAGVLDPGSRCLPLRTGLAAPGAAAAARASRRDACLDACADSRQACLSDVGRPGAFPALECARQFAQCGAQCPKE